MTKRLAWSFMLFLLSLVPVWAQGANASQELLPQTYTEVATLGRGQLLDASWRPDGQAILVNSTHGATVYNTDFVLLHDFEGTRHAAFSPDGQLIATTTLDPYELHFWDATSYAPVKSFALTPETNDYLYEGVVLAWSPDSLHVAVGGSRTVIVVVAASGEVIMSHPVDHPISYISWRPDGQRVAISGYGPFHVVDPFTEELDKRFATNKASGRALWSPDQTLFATMMIDYDSVSTNDLKIWDAETGALRLVIQAPFSKTFAWSPDSRSVVAGDMSTLGDDFSQRLFFWDATTGELIDGLPSLVPLTRYQKPFTSSAWNADQTQFMTVSEDNVLRLYDWPFDHMKEEAPRELYGYQGPLEGIAWNGTGTRIVSSSKDSGLQIWNPETGEPVLRLQAPRRIIGQVDWNSREDEIAFTTLYDVVYTWDFLTGSPNAAVTDYAYRQSDFLPVMAYSPDGRILASAGRTFNSSVLILNSGENWQDETKIEMDRTPWSLSWGGDSRRLAYNNTEAYVYDVEQQTTRMFSCEKNGGGSQLITAVALSPDGHILAAANDSVNICLWNVETGESIPLPHSETNYFGDVVEDGLSWNPDSQRLATITSFTHEDPNTLVTTYQSRIAIWDIPSGTLEALIETPATVTDMAWSPDGTQLAASDTDGLIHMWQQP